MYSARLKTVWSLNYLEMCPSWLNEHDWKSCNKSLKLHTEWYRSGHNELHWKCSVPPGTASSNLAHSANQMPAIHSDAGIFILCLLPYFCRFFRHICPNGCPKPR